MNFLYQAPGVNGSVFTALMQSWIFWIVIVLFVVMIILLIISSSSKPSNNNNNNNNSTNQNLFQRFLTRVKLAKAPPPKLPNTQPAAAGSLVDRVPVLPELNVDDKLEEDLSEYAANNALQFGGKGKKHLHHVKKEDVNLFRVQSPGHTLNFKIEKSKTFKESSDNKIILYNPERKCIAVLEMVPNGIVVKSDPNLFGRHFQELGPKVTSLAFTQRGDRLYLGETQIGALGYRNVVGFILIKSPIVKELQYFNASDKQKF